MNVKGILSLLNEIEQIIDKDPVSAKIKTRIVIDTLGWDKDFLALDSEKSENDVEDSVAMVKELGHGFILIEANDRNIYNRRIILNKNQISKIISIMPKGTLCKDSNTEAHRVPLYWSVYIFFISENDRDKIEFLYENEKDANQLFSELVTSLSLERIAKPE